MKPYLSILFLFLAFTGNAQYKRIGIGLSTGTQDGSDTYFSNYIIAEYNFKRTLSFRTGLGLEKTSYRVSDTWEYPLPIHTYSGKVRAKTICLPLLMKATFGKKFYIHLLAGVQFYGMQSASGKITKSYSDPDYPNETFDYGYPINQSWFANPMYGGGITFPVKDRVTFFAECQNTVFNRPMPATEAEVNNNSWGMSGLRFLAGITYQFNFSKKEEYRTSTWYPQLQKNQ